MPSYEYKALQANGKLIKGFEEADSEKQLRQILRDRGLLPTTVNLVEKQGGHSKEGSAKWFRSKLKIADISLFIRELYTLLDAGTSLGEALKSMSKQAESRNMSRFISSLHSRVSEGHSLANAMRNAPYEIPKEVIATIHAGEESGYLDKVLSRLAEAVEQQDQLNKKIQTALIYPVLMVVISIAIVLFLMVYIVPKVVTVFDNMQQSLPPLTQGLLNLSEYIQNHWMVMLIVFIAIWVVFLWLMKTPLGRYKIHAFFLMIPGIRRFLIYSSSARWARSLGVLLSSGVAIQDALRISSEVLYLEPLRKTVKNMEVDVREGESIAKAMHKAGFFPPLLLNLVKTGEGKGQLDNMLLKAAQHYEFSVESSANTAVSVIEPVMIIVMGGVVLTVVLAIMMPIFEMNQMVAG